MEVRSGYKQTEVGMIPQEWGVKTLAVITDCLDSVRIPLNEAQRAKRQGDIPYCGANGVLDYVDDFVIDDDIILVAEDGGHFDEYLTRPIAYRMTGRSWVNNHAHILKSAAGYDQGFIFYSLVHKNVLRYLASGTRAKLTRSELNKIEIPLPPTEAEQTGIADVLSAADALTDSLEQLLAKKHRIKQGVMQELLTGMRRLPGFTGEWEAKRLGNSASLKARIGWQGLTTAEYLDDGDYYLVTGTEFKDGYIDWSHCHFVDESRYRQDKYIQLKEHDVLVTKDGTIGKVAFVAMLPGPATLNSGVFVIRPTGGAFHPQFFSYLLGSNAFAAFLSQLSAGSTISHLYQKDFVGFMYETPPTIDEQAAISAIISDMDAEIAAIEAKLAKARQLKQGMMQELLTGKIRLE